jgi:Domain of unknown function (DUF4926)
MAYDRIGLLDTVMLLGNLPEHALELGEVGTVVELLAPDVFEVEFCDEGGQTYAELALRSEQFIVLRHQGKEIRSAPDFIAEEQL